MQKEESPTTQNRLLEEAYDRAVNGNRWKKIQDFIRSSQTSIYKEDIQKQQKQKLHEDSGVSKSQNGQIFQQNEQKDQLYTNNYIIKRPLIKQPSTCNTSAVKSNQVNFNNQKYLQMIDKQNCHLDPSVQKPQSPNQFYDEVIHNPNQEDQKLIDINIVDKLPHDKFMGFSEYDNKSLDTKSQITQLTDTIHSYKPNSQHGIAHLKKKSINNRSFQKFKSPLLNQKDIDMHLKDINNQYVVESVKESKSSYRINNEMNNQFKSSMQPCLKSSQQIESQQDLMNRVISKQKLMTIQQNQSKDSNIESIFQQQSNTQINPQFTQQQAYAKQYYIDPNDQDSSNAYASKYQSLKSFQGQNFGSGSNQKVQIKSDLDENLEFSKNLVNEMSTSEFNSKKNSNSQIKYINKQKQVVQKKLQANRNMNIKSSREETSYNRLKKQLQFDQKDQQTNIEPFNKKQQTYSDNLSAYELNKSNSFCQNFNDLGQNQNTHSNQVSLKTINPNKGMKELLSTQKLVSYQFIKQEVRKVNTPLRQNSIVSDNLSKKAQNIQISILGENEIKKELIESFQKMKLDVYSDILRIKKPQASAYIVGQLLCKTVNSFRGGQNKQTGFDSKFQEWDTIQEYVHKQPNVIKFNLEITQLIQHMILSKDYLNQIKSEQLKNHLKKIQKIQQHYFGLKMKSEIIKQFQTNKNFQVIVNLCFCICRYVLFHSERLSQINLQQEHKLNFEILRSRSNNMKSDYDKTSTQRSQISQNLIKKQDNLSTNLEKNESKFTRDASDRKLLKQSTIPKIKKSIPKIHDQMIESINSMCTPKALGYKNNILQPRENKTDMIRKSTIRKEDSFHAISKQKNFQYLNDSFQNEYQSKIEGRQSPAKEINENVNQSQLNKFTSQNQSFTQTNLNNNPFSQSKQKKDNLDQEVIIESKNEYIEKVQIQTGKESKRSLRSNQKQIIGNYYFTPQGKNFQEFIQSDKKSSYQILPQPIRKLKVFDRLNLSSVQRKRLQQQQTIKTSPQRQNIQANDAIKIAADQVKINILPKKIMNFQNDQNQIVNNEKENLQGTQQIYQDQINNHPSYIMANLQCSQEIPIDQQDRNSPNKFPETCKEKGNYFIQSQSLNNPQLIMQIRQQEIQKSSPQKVYSLINKYTKNVNNGDIMSQKHNVDQALPVQQSSKRQRKSRQERSNGNKSINKESKLSKNQTKQIIQNHIEYNNKNGGNINQDNTLNEFMEIEKKLSNNVKQVQIIQNNQDLEELQSQTIDQCDILNQIMEQENNLDPIQNVDENIIGQNNCNIINNQSNINDQSNQNQSFTQSQKQELVINSYENQKLMILNSEQQLTEKIDSHYQQAYNTIIQIQPPDQIFQEQNYLENCENQNQLLNENNQNYLDYVQEELCYQENDVINDEVEKSNEISEEEENESFLDPVEEAQKIIGIIKAELENEDNEIPQIQQLTLTKIDQTYQHVRSNSTIQNSNFNNWNNTDWINPIQNNINSLHKKHQTLTTFNPEIYEIDSLDKSQKANKQSILDTKLKNFKKFKYLEKIRNKNIQKSNEKKAKDDNKSCSEKASIQNQKFKQNIFIVENPFKKYKELKQNNQTLTKSYEQSDEPQTAQVLFQQGINQNEEKLFEQISEKLSNQDDQEPIELQQCDHQNEIEDLIIDKKSQNKIEQIIKNSDTENSEEKEEQFYMQEIVSPFRKLRTSQLNADTKSQSPFKIDLVQEPDNLEKLEWEINPVKVIRQPSGQVQKSQYSQYDEIFKQELGLRDESQDENLFARYNDEDIFVYQNEEESDGDISPGKLKNNVIESRKHIIERIDETMKEIQQNSPTRNSFVNIDMIQKLKERRQNQKIKIDMDNQIQEQLQQQNNNI